MPEMATADQALPALRRKYIILAVPGELAALIGDWQHVAFRIGCSRVIS
jgi:hypothetical protein